MSYILDALRRADSERERERSAVPGLHTQAVPAGAIDAESEPQRGPWKWLIAAAFVALLGLVAWLWFDRAAGPEPAAAVTSAPPAPLPPPIASAPATAAPVVAAIAPPPATPATLAAASAAPAHETTPAARKPPTSVAAVAPRKPVATTPAASGPAAAKAGAKAEPPAKASEPEPRISTLGELPDDVRRELPALSIGGSIYSKSAANRMLVINGQVFHEGDELATGLVLEQIRQKAAVLKFKGYRYEITY